MTRCTLIGSLLAKNVLAGAANRVDLPVPTTRHHVSSVYMISVLSEATKTILLLALPERYTGTIRFWANRRDLLGGLLGRFSSTYRPLVV